MSKIPTCLSPECSGIARCVWGFDDKHNIDTFHFRHGTPLCCVGVLLFWSPSLLCGIYVALGPVRLHVDDIGAPLLFCFPPQIRFLLLQNRQGKTRLSKWYIPMSTDEKIKTQTEVHHLVVNRDPKFTNFIEVRPCPALPATARLVLEPKDCPSCC